MQVSFRCRSMTYDEYHHILVPEKGHVVCSCQGVDWCSHIEATLVYGERYMVPPEDRADANRAQIMARGKIEEPKDWKADWRNNRRWRGLPVKEPKAYEMLMKGIPVASFQGMGLVRKEAVKIAEENGWEVVSNPTRGVIVHVVLDGKKTDRSKHAEHIGALLVDGNEWPAMARIGKTLRSHMADLLSKGNLS